MNRSSLILTVAVLLLTNSLATAQDKSGQADETIAFFESGAIPELKLLIGDESQQRLRDMPREYSRCTLEEFGEKTFKSIGVKLKGAAGSYSDFDDRPGFTVNIDKFKSNQRFHGMEKFHLNNAAQDETYLNEWLGSEIFRQASLRAPRVGHVRLWINDRDMGLYVLRQGFDKTFLVGAFGDSKGNLYDGGFIQDIDSELEMDSSQDPDDRTDLVELANACFHPKPETRRKLIAERLDIEEFLSFMAIERICGHWDGYTLNQNNYRIYFPADGKAVFLPHGMDQLFGDPGAGLYDHSASLLAAAVMQNDPWRRKYQQRLTKICESLQPVEAWLAKIDELQGRLQPVLRSINPELAANHSDRTKELKERFTQRFQALPDLIRDVPVPMEFDSSGTKNEGVVVLIDWYPVEEAEHVSLEEVEIGGVSAYSITCKQFGDFTSSWRRQVLLTQGTYRFQARVKTKDVIPIPDDQAHGAGIRRVKSGRSHEVIGTNDWTLLSYEFHVPEDQRQVELVLELRARHGTTWFDRDSPKLERVGN